MDDQLHWCSAVSWAVERIRAAADRSKPGSNLQYAAQYAIEMLHMQPGTRQMHVQALYVLNNLQYWRGKEASQVKDVLRGL